jgi:hypothetical protein
VPFWFSEWIKRQNYIRKGEICCCSIWKPFISGSASIFKTKANSTWYGTVFGISKVKRKCWRQSNGRCNVFTTLFHNRMPQYAKIINATCG